MRTDPWIPPPRALAPSPRLARPHLLGDHPHLPPTRAAGRGGGLGAGPDPDRLGVPRGRRRRRPGLRPSRSRVRVMRRPTPGGPAAARNTGRGRGRRPLAHLPRRRRPLHPPAPRAGRRRPGPGRRWPCAGPAGSTRPTAPDPIVRAPGPLAGGRRVATASSTPPRPISAPPRWRAERHAALRRALSGPSRTSSGGCGWPTTPPSTPSPSSAARSGATHGRPGQQHRPGLPDGSESAATSTSSAELLRRPPRGPGPSDGPGWETMAVLGRANRATARQGLPPLAADPPQRRCRSGPASRTVVQHPGMIQADAGAGVGSRDRAEPPPRTRSARRRTPACHVPITNRPAGPPARGDLHGAHPVPEDDPAPMGRHRRLRPRRPGRSAAATGLGHTRSSHSATYWRATCVLYYDASPSPEGRGLHRHQPDGSAGHHRRRAGPDRPGPPHRRRRAD